MDSMLDFLRDSLKHADLDTMTQAHLKNCYLEKKGLCKFSKDDKKLFSEAMKIVLEEIISGKNSSNAENESSSKSQRQHMQKGKRRRFHQHKVAIPQQSPTLSNSMLSQSVPCAAEADSISMQAEALVSGTPAEAGHIHQHHYHHPSPLRLHDFSNWSSVIGLPTGMENLQSDDPQYPRVMDINPNLDGEILEYGGEEVEEQFSEEDCDEEEMMPEGEEETERQLHTDYLFKCRSIRIGSYKVYPLATSLCVPVALLRDSISFQAPMLSDSNRHVHVTLKHEHIQKVYVHFGRCLQVMFVFTTPKFGELVRKALHMVSNESYFDPTSKDDTTQKLTFLIERISEEQKYFIQTIFPGDQKVVTINMKAANEILMMSTPKLTKPIQRLAKVPNKINNRLPQVSNKPIQRL